MDSVTADLNKYLQSLEDAEKAGEMADKENQENPEVRDNVVKLCRVLLEQDLSQAECIQAVGAVATKWNRVHASMIDDNFEEAERIVEENINMVANAMAEIAIRDKNSIFRVVCKDKRYVN